MKQAWSRNSKRFAMSKSTGGQLQDVNYACKKGETDGLRAPIGQGVG